jgi:phosphoribosylamine--glycine ligase
LADGIVDLFKKEKLNIFGPEKKAAILESSKAACKNLLKQWNIPTADFRVFSDYQEARKHLQKASFPLVLKADGLCQGKGVVICKALADAEKALTELMKDKVFGTAASSVVIEDFLEGEEVSIIALSDGKNFICFPPSQDHKRVYDNDQGPNTGGMGAYSPVSVADPALLRYVEDAIIKRTIQGMYKDVACFKGFLYAGLMITKDKQPYVLEYNVRSGDPETQVILPKLQSDLFELILSADNGTLSSARISWDPRVCLCAVLTSGGYPGAYKKGFEIHGLDAPRDSDVFVYHAGTAFDAHGRVVTAGGRVLNIVGLSDTILAAQKKVYKAIQSIHFEGMHYRTDIGHRAAQHR